MKCPICNRPGIVKDSRYKGGTQRRIRACNSGHRWTTFERVEDDHGLKTQVIARKLRALAASLETPAKGETA